MHNEHNTEEEAEKGGKEEKNTTKCMI